MRISCNIAALTRATVSCDELDLIFKILRGDQLVRLSRLFMAGIAGASVLMSAGAAIAAAPASTREQVKAPEGGDQQPSAASKARKGGAKTKPKGGFGSGAFIGVIGAVGVGVGVAAAAGGGNGGSPASP